MSRIGQLGELKALRADVDTLKRSVAALSTAYEAAKTVIEEMAPRIEALEAKRGPGRPKNEQHDSR